MKKAILTTALIAILPMTASANDLPPIAKASDVPAGECTFRGLASFVDQVYIDGVKHRCPHTGADKVAEAVVVGGVLVVTGGILAGEISFPLFGGL